MYNLDIDFRFLKHGIILRHYVHVRIYERIVRKRCIIFSSTPRQGRSIFTLFNGSYNFYIVYICTSNTIAL